MGSCCRLLPENIVHGERGAIDGASGLDEIKRRGENRTPASQIRS
jgi:hypothetical protein